MNREHILAVLYDITMVIGGEVKVKPLLTRTLQRLLYHTSFPAGLVLLDLPADDGGSEVAACIEAAVGDYELGELVGRKITVPAALVRGGSVLAEDAVLLLRALPCARDRYGVFLRLPIDGHGVILLLAVHAPHTELPLTQIFQPVLANLDKAILLCRHSEAYAAGLTNERRRADVALHKANRALKTLSACDSALMHIVAEDELLQQICGLIVDLGGHRLAWVAYVEHDAGKSLRRVAAAGDDGQYLDDLRVSWAEDSDYGRGPIGRAVRTGVLQYAQDIASDPSYGPWRESARHRGYASTIALPLLDAAGTAFGVLAVYSTDVHAFNDEEIALLAELAGDLAFGIRGLRTHVERERLELAEMRSAERLRRALNGTILAIAQTVEKRDPYTAGHQQRVAQLVEAMARELGWPDQRIEGVRLGASIHDIGKIHVPAEILSRPGVLSDVEFALIRTHSMVGYEILRDIEFPWPVAAMILQHHERLDGSGYPQGLKDGEILEEARLLAVADVVESMASHRPYRPAKGLDAAFAEIQAHRGSLFEPAAVDACLRLFREHGFAFS